VREIPSIKKLIIPTLFIIALYFFQVQRGNDKTPKWVIQGSIMGTTYTVQTISLTAPSSEDIQTLLDKINQVMSTYLPNSELNQFNQHPTHQAFKPSSQLAYVLKASLQIYEKSQGVFDITVGPLVNAWGFGPNKNLKNPSPELIKKLLTQVGSNFLLWQNDQIIKKHEKLYCDLSAIAKGYAVDQVSQYLSDHGFTHHWVDIGGEVRVMGMKAEGKKWRIGIERPATDNKRSIYQIIPLSDMSMATSGDYRNRYVDAQGVERSHTIDPRTGNPVQHQLASVSVLHPKNMYADAWATALNVIGAKEGVTLADQHGIRAFFIIRENDGDEIKFTHQLSQAMKTYLKEHRIVLKTK
jgi:FAD:protein FMN transferase